VFKENDSGYGWVRVVIGRGHTTGKKSLQKIEEWGFVGII